MDNSKSKGADVWFFPPILLFASLVISVSLELFIYPLKILSGTSLQLIVGALIIAASFINCFYALWLFKNHDENPNPKSRTTQLFTGGPYQYSRNPMYLSFVILLLGCGCAFNSLWYIYFAITNFILLHYGIILPEEKYLEKEIGLVYLDYKKSVRRWL